MHASLLVAPPLVLMPAQLYQHADSHLPNTTLLQCQHLFQHSGTFLTPLLCPFSCSSSVSLLWSPTLRVAAAVPVLTSVVTTLPKPTNTHSCQLPGNPRTGSQAARPFRLISSTQSRLTSSTTGFLKHSQAHKQQPRITDCSPAPLTYYCQSAATLSSSCLQNQDSRPPPAAKWFRSSFDPEPWVSSVQWPISRRSVSATLLLRATLQACSPKSLL